MADEKLDLRDERFRDFVHKLGHDDGFRAELERDPRGVLEANDIPFDAEKLPATVTLPGKEEVRSGSQEALSRAQTALLIPLFGLSSGPEEG